MMLRPKTWLAAARAAAGYSAPLIPFASFPAALTVEGQIRRPAELPHVSLIALGGLWRPLGGRQVLASRFINPVTVQSLTYQRAETIGPFPGGLVRANMGLLFRCMFDFPAIGNVDRGARITIGPPGHTESDAALIASWVNGTGGMGSRAELEPHLIVISDTLNNHPATSRSDVGGTFTAINGWSMIGGTLNPAVDFSQPWEIAVWLQSAADTAVTITGAAWSGGVATYTTSAAHTLAVGDKDVISGITPSGYNGTFIVSAVGSPTTFSVPMAANPGTYTSGGSSARTSNMRLLNHLLAFEG